jgi:hypothetical protein
MRSLALTLLAVSFLAAAAWSQCNNPKSPGVVICTPTNGSTVVSPGNLDPLHPCSRGFYNRS